MKMGRGEEQNGISGKESFELCPSVPIEVI